MATWVGVALLGAVALGVIAITRGEPISSAWFLVAALCVYAIGYRFYSRRSPRTRSRSTTRARRRPTGSPTARTSSRPTGGSCSATTSRRSPARVRWSGPILAAQFGYLPGTLYILIGVVLGGAVQDFTILVGSMRRDGKSLGQMVREEIGPVGGAAALVGVLAIMVILIGVLGLVVVNAMYRQPVGDLDGRRDDPDRARDGRVHDVRCVPGACSRRASVGVALVLFAVVGGALGRRERGAAAVLRPRQADARARAGRSTASSRACCPVWLLLAPRDYLSAFVKLGTVALLALGLAIAAPARAAPRADALHRRHRARSSPGQVFPFCFITIACGAISGFHALIASGTTPKLLDSETDARMIGYGAMLMESFVAIMALLSAARDGPRRLLRDQLAAGR